MVRAYRRLDVLSEEADVAGNVLCVAVYEPDVGYAWWLIEELWIELASLYHDRGLRCVLAYPIESRVPDRIRAAPIDVIFQDFLDRSPSGVRAACRLLRRRNIETIYLTSQPFFAPRYLAWRACGVRTIVSHDHNPGDRPPVAGISGVVKSLRNSLGPATCDLYIALSPLMMERAVLNGRIPRRRCRVVQNGILPIDCGIEEKTKLREELELQTTQRVVVTVARAHPYKNIDFIIRVAERLHAIGRDDIVFVHVGDGLALEGLRTQAREAGLLDRTFFFLGLRSDVRSLLCECDMAVHPSRGEGFSVSILEYMSAGLTTLVPDIPSVSQAIIHGQTGLVYAADDVDAVSDLVGDLARDGGRIERLGQAARDEVLQKYSLERTRRELRELIEARI